MIKLAHVCSVSLIGLLSLLPIQSVTGQGEWIADLHTGCTVWNPDPKAAETIRWDGDCRNNRAEGFGTLVWYQDGVESERATGRFDAGRIEGDGRWWWATGHQYQGQFAAGLFHGRGRFTWPNGSTYVGEFKNNLRHGNGHHQSGNGAQFKGKYVEGKRHGAGSCYQPGGGWEPCYWWHGEQLQQGLAV